MLKTILSSPLKRHSITTQLAKVNWLGSKASSICGLFVSFMGLTQYFLWLFFLLPRFFCKILIHARNSYLAVWQEFKIFTHSQNPNGFKEAPSTFKLLMLPVSTGTKLHLNQLLPKITMLNIFHYYPWLFYLEYILIYKCLPQPVFSGWHKKVYIYIVTLIPEFIIIIFLNHWK